MLGAELASERLTGSRALRAFSGSRALPDLEIG